MNETENVAGRTALVTGAGGLLGGWATTRLATAGAAVVAVDFDWAGRDSVWRFPSSVQLAKADVRDADEIRRLLSEHRVDLVLHLAAQSIVGVARQDPVGTLESNVAATWTLLDACRQADSVTGIVLASSEMVYGEGVEGRPFVESLPMLPDNLYGGSKAASDLIARAYARTFGLPVAIARFGSLYGGGDLNWSRIIPGTIRSALQGEAPVIRSDGRYVRDYLHAGDAAAGISALLGAVERDPGLRGEAFNFAAPERVSVLEVAQRILRLTGSPHAPDVRNESVTNDRNPPLSAERARETLGWEPTRSLDEGLEETIEWYRDYLRVN